MRFFSFFLLSIILSFHVSVLSARTIDLPAGVNAEGVTHLRGSLFLASSIPTGDVHLIDTRTDVTTRIVRAPPNRSAFGLDVDDNSRVYVAGVGPGLADFALMFLGLDFSNITASLHVYDISTGDEVASCTIPDGSLVNDVSVAGRFAYFTDSGRPFLYRLDIDALPECRVDLIPLDETVFGGDGFRGNGIAFFRGGLIVGNSGTGTLYFVDLNRGGETTELLEEGAVPAQGGLNIRSVGGRLLLFVANGEPSSVLVFELGFDSMNRMVKLKSLANVTNPSFSTPSTVATSADVLLVPNLNSTARINGEPFTVSAVRLDEVFPSLG